MAYDVQEQQTEVEAPDHDVVTMAASTDTGTTTGTTSGTVEAVAGPPAPREDSYDVSRSPLRKALERSQRFRCDSVMGGILHLGKVSYRELAPVDAVHITIDGNHLSAHVDDVSPVKQCSDGKSRYSWPRVLVHNLFAIVGDLGRRLRGHRGEQRCNLDCEVVWVDDDGTVELSCEEAECHTCTDERTPPTPAVGREPLNPRKPS